MLVINGDTRSLDYGSYALKGPHNPPEKANGKY